MAGPYAANAYNFAKMTTCDTDSDVGEDLGSEVGTFSSKLQFAFCMLILFWKERENKVAYMVGIFLILVVFLVVFHSFLLMMLFETTQSINNC